MSSKPPGRLITDEVAERIAWLWQDLDACCCQLWGRPKCPVCRRHEAELAAYGVRDLEAA